MADTPIEPPRPGDYSPSMETRLAIVETIAQQNLANQQALGADVRSLRAEIGTLFAELRAEMGGLRSELRSEVSELRRIHDRDFRRTFGAIVTTALGLAALIAHVAHWL